YVYSVAAIASSYRELHRALGRRPHTLCYAIKAGGNLAILRLLARLGSSFDIVSGGELDRLRRIGVDGGRIVFSGVGKTREEIREALRYPGTRGRGAKRSGILLFNIQSEAELEVLAGEAPRQVSAGGAWPAARRRCLARRGSRWICWPGLSANIGSPTATLAPFRRGLARLAQYSRELWREGIDLRYLDFGGGLGIRYTGEDAPARAAYA